MEVCGQEVVEVPVKNKILDLVKYPLTFSLPISPSTLIFLFFLACASGICMQPKRGEADPR